MVSALKADGINDLLTALATAVPAGPFLYPEDQAADLPLRLLAAEVTREQVFLQLHQELPYEAAVETDKWEDRPDGSVRVEQTIHVQRDGQRAIFLGKGGARIKRDRCAGPSRAQPDVGAARASLSTREGERALGRRSFALPRQSDWITSLP